MSSPCPLVTSETLSSTSRPPVDEMHHRLDDRVALVRLHVRHHAEVEVAQLALGRRQKVARVRVGVEEAVLEHLAERALHQRIHQFLRICRVGGVRGR